MPTVTFVDDPPQPMGGEGEVLDMVNGTQVVLTWEGGNLVDVSAATEEVDMLDGTMIESNVPGEVHCIKCLSTGPHQEIHCWPVTC